MKKKKKRRQQVTCWCQSYKFLYRIGGGKCNGIAWTESYKEIYGRCCKVCNVNNGGCDVAEGREALDRCEAIEEYRLRPPAPRLPRDVEDVMEEMCAQRMEEDEENF